MATLRGWIPALSVVAAIVLGFYMVGQGSSWISFAGLVTGAVWVWLSARASIWNFPLGLVNAVIVAYDLYHQAIYADATLYAIFFVQLAWGWWQWTHGGPRSSPRMISRVPGRELGWIVAGVLAVWTFAFFQLGLLQGYMPLWDGLGFSASIGSQYLLDRKYIETWPGWVGVNVLYTAVYIAKGLWPYAVLSAILLAMSFVGWSKWHEKLRDSKQGAAVEER